MRSAGLAAVLLLALAGCSGGGAGPSGGEASGDAGVLRGTVVDDAIRPLEGAAVKLSGPSVQMETNTSGDGSFRFDGLPAGSYLVRAAKSGHASTQQSAQVMAGVEEPVPVRLVLLVLADSTPFWLDGQWDGFIECSFRIRPGDLMGAGAGVNACNHVGNVSLNQDANHPLPLVSSSASLVQGELTWESGQALASGLSFVAGPPGCEDVKYVRSDGPSPLVLRLQQSDLIATQTTTDGVCYRVFAWVAEESQNTLGVVVEQDFQAFFHQFYNFRPPEGWQFSVDGEPVVPP